MGSAFADNIFESQSLGDVLNELDHVDDPEHRAQLISCAEMLVDVTQQEPQTHTGRAVIRDSRGCSITDSDPDVTLEIVVSDSSEGDSDTQREPTWTDEEARPSNPGLASDSQTNPPPYQPLVPAQAMPGPSCVGLVSGGTSGPNTDRGNVTPILSPTTASGNKGFVVYRGRYQAHADDRSSGGVFKGFPSYEIAHDVYQQAFQTGVVGALNDEPLDRGTPQYYVVVQGIQPAVYSNA
ncbi:hypothetical protein Moror_15499 [Moniliophthora roreri MCA 2997]|uniref:Uncharacterized protein n=1 Tax=Moniliophthora roreri (strain MCA 2997) TaxID=1381753 RepID=V2W635_MONRO|nr:hypothetical protein Moror_15499 [Moniliophthora roreri MCA 2997]